MRLPSTSPPSWVSLEGVVTGWSIVASSKTMYNLEVAQDHTFTVGDGQWVVHNCGGGPQFSDDPSVAGHIFRNAEGHLTEDTPENRQLFVDTASNGKSFGVDQWGKEWYAQILPDERQSWVAVRNNIIVHAGVSDTPYGNFDPKRGIIP